MGAIQGFCLLTQYLLKHIITLAVSGVKVAEYVMLSACEITTCTHNKWPPIATSELVNPLGAKIGYIRPIYRKFGTLRVKADFQLQFVC